MTGLDARRLIEGDLGAARRERALHYRGALLLAALAPALLLVATGLRGDLLRQPGWLVAAQALVWTLALVALPAVGLGLWFPGRAARALLAALAAVAAVLVAGGPELVELSAGPGELARGPVFGFCTHMTLGAGALLVAVGVVSGAFAERRRAAATLWIAAAIALVAIDTVAWHCPATALAHTLPSHLGAGALLLLVAGLVGVLVHRRAAP